MATLLTKLQGDVKTAMKARDSTRVESLRMFVNSVQNEAKAQLRELEDIEIVKVLQREKKKRIEAAEAFEAGGHPDRAMLERDQAAMLDSYLPAELSAAELTDLVAQAITEVGAGGPSDMGSVMKVAMEKVAGRADGKAVAQAVNKALRSL